MIPERVQVDLRPCYIIVGSALILLPNWHDLEYLRIEKLFTVHRWNLGLLQVHEGEG